MEQDSLEDGALKDSFEKGREKNERKEKKKRAAREQGNGKEESASGDQGEENHEANRIAMTPLNSHNSTLPKRAYHRTTKLVSHTLVWKTQDQKQIQVAIPPFPQANHCAITRSTWTMMKGS